MELVTHSTEETQALARRVVHQLLTREGIAGTATIVALQGDLGAGKTAFTKGLAKALGIQEEVTSPTFVIQKIYPIPGSGPFAQLVHIDAYRLEGRDELRTIGWNEYATDPKNLVVMEWPEQVGLGVPERAYWFMFEHVRENERKIEVDERLSIGIEDRQ